MKQGLPTVLALVVLTPIPSSFCESLPMASQSDRAGSSTHTPPNNTASPELALAPEMLQSVLNALLDDPSDVAASVHFFDLSSHIVMLWIICTFNWRPKLSSNGTRISSHLGRACRRGIQGETRSRSAENEAA